MYVLEELFTNNKKRWFMYLGRILSGWKKIGGQSCFFTCFYRSPSQNKDQFELFCGGLELRLSNINDLNLDCSILIGGFNAISSKWWAPYKDSPKGHKIESLTSTARYSQLIDQPKHITNTSSSCKDLIFTTNSSFVKDSNVELSSFNKCHHNWQKYVLRMVKLKDQTPL